MFVVAFTLAAALAVVAAVVLALRRTYVQREVWRTPKEPTGPAPVPRAA